MSITLPKLPERPWRMFCTKCGRTTPLYAKDVQHSPPGSPFVSHFGVCPCGYQALAEQAPWTADQLRAYVAAVTAAKDAEIAALRAENDKLREALAQKVVSQTMLTGLVVQDGGLTIGLEGGAAGLLVEMFAQQFKDGGGTNYLQLSFTSSVCLPGEAFIVTVQKRAGKTPHQLRMDAETEAAALRAEVAGLREFVEHVRRNGSTHLANMAVAVLAARKGEA